MSSSVSHITMMVVYPRTPRTGHRSTRISPFVSLAEIVCVNATRKRKPLMDDAPGDLRQMIARQRCRLVARTSEQAADELH